MKITLFFSVLFSIVFTTSLAAQQWEPLGSNDFNQPTTHRAYDDYIFKKDSKGTLYVAYYVGGHTTENRIIVSKKSGNTWETVGGPESIVGRFEYFASIGFAIDKFDNIYVSYSDMDRQDKVTVKTWNGKSWESIGNSGFSASSVLETSIVIDDSGNPYVLYKDEGNSYYATVKKWDGNEWIIIGTEAFTKGGLDSFIGLDSKGNPYITYTDYMKGSTSLEKWNGSDWETIVEESDDYVIWMGMDNNDKIYSAIIETKNKWKATVKTWNGNSWDIFGDAAFSEGGVTDITMSFNSSGIPHIAYATESYENGNLIQKVMLNKWDGTSWEAISDNGFSVRGRLLGVYEDNAPTRLSIVIDKAETPYISYSEYSYDFKVKVKKFNGNSWEHVGETGITEGFRYGWDPTSLAVNSSGTPFIFYLENELNDVNKGKVKIKRFDGSAWETMGDTKSFGANKGSKRGLVVNSSGNPLVAFSDYDNGNKATVKRWNGNTWETIGKEGFSDGNAYGICFAIDSADKLYIAYKEDIDNSTPLIIKKFNGNTWETLGDTEIGISEYEEFCLTVDASGTPYITSESGPLKKFNGSTWEALGGKHNINDIFKIFLTLDRSGTPFISFGHVISYMNLIYNSTVKKFNGSEWETLLSERSFGGGGPLVFDAMGDLYFAYPDDENYGTVTLKKFDGNEWETVGNERFTAGEAKYLDLAIDNTGYLTLVYDDSHYIYAKKFATGLVAVPNYADNSTNVIVYPNPTSDNFKVSIDNSYNTVEVEIYDILGNKVLTVKNNLENIDVSTFSNGIYIIMLKTYDDNFRKKLIIKK